MDAVDITQEAEAAELAERARRGALRPPVPAVPVGGRSCSRCGQPIPSRRLAAPPGARLCLPCQAEIEGGG